ncbi:MAG: HAMP domain-containing sensor histidine kinase [Erysipelotrichaceae bacterium]|nr:HAMP domain-containing sensor histidine kinase [Erysipelotrichaceae bacterium]
MKYLRDVNIQKQIYVSIAVLLIFMVLAYVLKPSVMPWVFLVGCSFIVLHVVFQIQRMKEIEVINDAIRFVLHGEKELRLAEYQEGQLSILKNELSKLVSILNNQNTLLQKDKDVLTDSIADISHQLKTPLTSMNLILPFLRKNDLSYQKRLELVQDLKRLLTRLDWLISALLKMSKIDAQTARFQEEEVRVADLIEDSCELISIPMELKNQNLVIHQQGDEVFTGDYNWTKEAISNILKNCMEHTPNDGTITILVSQNPIYTEIIIKDNGPGINEKDIHNIFKRFYKGENSSEQSVGIGLALARMIIVQQNGTIKVENNPDAGCRFIIRFYAMVV